MAGIVPATTTVLVKQAMRTMMLTKLKTAAAAVIAIGLLTCVAAGFTAVAVCSAGREQERPFPRASTGPRRAIPANRTRATRKSRPGTDQKLTLPRPRDRPRWKAGRACVDLYAPVQAQETLEPVLRAESAADGKFQFDVSKSEFDSIVEQGPFASFTVVATAAGLGPDWAEMRKPPEGEVLLQLVDDTGPNRWTNR